MILFVLNDIVCPVCIYKQITMIICRLFAIPNLVCEESESASVRFLPPLWSSE